MMEKDFNKQHMDELIQDWTEDKLPAAEENEITDRILDFVENDDEEIEVEEFLDLHIHKLAEEERRGGRRKWKILVASVAAASVVLLVIATTFISTHENDQHTDTEYIAGQNLRVSNHSHAQGSIGTEPYSFSDSTENRQIGAEKKLRSGQGGTEAMAEAAPSSTRKRVAEERAMKQNEETAEVILTETLAEINAGLVSMADNTKECLSMTNASMIPVSLKSDDNETNIIETNLINALYEIRNLNIELNFNTDNKTTEI